MFGLMEFRLSCLKSISEFQKDQFLVLCFSFSKQMIYIILLDFSSPFHFVDDTQCVKGVHIRSYSGPYFPAFGLITESYGVSLRIQSECGKMRTRITPNMYTFYALCIKSRGSDPCSFSI